ncbi:hypothetical protein M0R45_023863 [Rubus argutus]|uniref:Secreted protein n=1 Tax=Rubus argutus TaxID=59490 RepID=A0AAW1WPV5_RUBAR
MKMLPSQQTVLLGTMMTVTWTSGYNIDEAVPFVEWGLQGESQIRSPGTLTFTRETVWSTGTNSWLARARVHPHKFSERFVAKFIVHLQARS